MHFLIFFAYWEILQKNIAKLSSPAKRALLFPFNRLVFIMVLEILMVIRLKKITPYITYAIFCYLKHLKLCDRLPKIGSKKLYLLLRSLEKINADNSFHGIL